MKVLLRTFLISKLAVIGEQYMRPDEKLEYSPVV